MFIEFANMILDEVRMHPYWDGTQLDYYEHMSETRPVPDTIMIAGLLFHYSTQQASDKQETYGAQFIRMINQELWRRLNGNTKIQMKVTDNGTNPKNYTAKSTDKKQRDCYLPMVSTVKSPLEYRYAAPLTIISKGSMSRGTSHRWTLARTNTLHMRYNAFCDWRGQIVRDPGADFISGE